MKLSTALSFLCLAGVAFAVPRKQLPRRQATSSTCSCPSDVTVTQTAINTVTQTGTVITISGSTITTQGTTSTLTTTITTTTEIEDEPEISTLTVGRTTTRVTSSITTYTSTSYYSNVVTTCIPREYKRKRQVSDTAGTTTVTSAPATLSTTTTFSGQSTPASCVCRLISAFGTSTSTSPACSCSPVQTSTITLSSTTTELTTTTLASTDYITSSIDQTTLSTLYIYITDVDTPVETSTTTVARVTVVTYRSTASVTVSATSTFNSCPRPSETCGNQGIKFALYDNTNAAGANNTNKDSTYSTFDPAIFKQRTPMYQNTTYTLGGFVYTNAAAVQIHVYGSPKTYESDYIALNHVGYVFAPVTGTYTWSLSAADDIVMLWVGDNAYSGYTRANANIIRYYGQGSSTYQSIFTEGEYYPFRIVFANAQEALAFQASLTAPGGEVILNSNSQASPYLVQYSCDLTTAPPFAAFGSET